MSELKCQYSKEMCPYTPVALSIQCDECMVKKAYKCGERKKAHYIKAENGEWYCSSCKRIDDKYSVARFCWWCGAEICEREVNRNDE